jgi:hypothetical protein
LFTDYGSNQSENNRRGGRATGKPFVWPSLLVFSMHYVVDRAFGFVAKSLIVCFLCLFVCGPFPSLKLAGLHLNRKISCKNNGVGRYH